MSTIKHTYIEPLSEECVLAFQQVICESQYGNTDPLIEDVENPWD